MKLNKILEAIEALGILKEIEKLKEISGRKVEILNSGATVQFLRYLADVSISNPQNNDSLIYNATLKKWVNGPGGASGDFVSHGSDGQGTEDLNYVAFNTVYSPTGLEAVGTVYWDSTHHGLEYVIDQYGSITIGNEDWEVFTNLSGITLVNGDVVSIVGASGNREAMDLTDATDDQSATACSGMVTVPSINDNQPGRITRRGAVRGLDTSSFTEGLPVYVDPANPGKLTQTVPTAPNYFIHVGIVTVSHATEGVINVNISVNPKLDALTDVDGSAPTTTGDLLTWNQTSGVWERNSYNITNYLTTSSASSTYLKLDASNGPLTGALTIVAGNTTTPGINFTGDTNTGIYSPGTGRLAWVASGTERWTMGLFGRFELRTDQLNCNTASAQALTIKNNGNLTFTTSAGFVTDFAANNSTAWMRITGSAIRFGNINDSAATAAFNISGVKTTQIGMVVKGAALQSADLAQYQNNSGTVLAGVNPSGYIFGSRVYIGAIATGTYMESGTPGYRFYDGGTEVARMTSNQMLAGIANSNISFPGQMQLSTVATGAGYASRNAKIVTNIGALNQATTNIFNVFLNSDTFTNRKLGLYGYGQLILGDIAGSQTPEAQLHVQTYSKSVPVAIFEAQSSQTANITEWQNSSGTVLASVNQTGVVTTSGRKQKIAIKSADYTLTDNDEVVVFTATATATLPAATGSGQTHRIICRSGILTIDGNSSDTIKGSLTQTLTAGEDLIITDTASNIWE